MTTGMLPSNDAHLIVHNAQSEFLFVAFAVLLLAGITGTCIRLDRRRRLRRRSQPETTEATAGTHLRGPRDGGAWSRNEHHAALLVTYRGLLDIAARRGIAPNESQTLREFEREFRSTFDLQTSTAVTDLFDVFEATVYGGEVPDPRLRRRAFRAYAMTVEEIAQQEDRPANVFEHLGTTASPVTTEAPPPARQASAL